MDSLPKTGLGFGEIDIQSTNQVILTSAYSVSALDWFRHGQISDSQLSPRLVDWVQGFLPIQSDKFILSRLKQELEFSIPVQIMKKCSGRIA